jgi:hypothetical protein
LPLIAFALFAGGCHEACDSPAPLNTADIVVSKAGGAAHPFGVDICIDATPSMDGFAAPPNSVYRAFLEDLEGSMVSGVKNVGDLRFYKFGERIREMTRDEFRNARSRAFYHEPGIFRATDIELVFRTPDQVRASAAAVTPIQRPERRVIVVVTDLFQRDQDVNGVVKQIKTRCLSDPRCSVGVMAIPSEFDGTVYDARVPSFPYRSTGDRATFRPFYLLMFGPEDELRVFADVLSSRKYIDLRRFSLIGSRTVAQFTAETKRDLKSTATTNHKQCGSPLDAAFNLRRGFDEASVTTAVRITPDAQSFGFNPSRIAIRVFRQSNGKLLPADGEVVTKATPRADGVEIASSIKPPGAKGDYVYVFELVTGEVNGFVMPRWIADFTSSDPRPEHDPARTLNLDRFVEQLIATSVLDDHHQPKLARYRVLIHKL